MPLGRSTLLTCPSPIWNPPLATSTPFNTLSATPPLTDRSTPAVKAPRLVAFKLDFAALRSMPVVVKVLQSSLSTGVTTAEPRTTLLRSASTP